MFSALIFIINISLVFSIGNVLLGPGLSCTIKSLIPGSPQQSPVTMSGVCYSPLTCRSFSGVPIGRCGSTTICCVFPRTCDGVSAQNATYFTNPRYPTPYNNSVSCALTIQRTPGVNRICQLRLDFIDFELTQPHGGNCEKDRLLVSGQNANSLVPPICGLNTGQHMYVDIDGSQGPYIIRVDTKGEGKRRWNILISQIECLNPSKAPQNCLQYHIGPSGTFMSFNYDHGYINSLDYTICFRKENGFCTQTYNVIEGNYTDCHCNTSFNIININERQDIIPAENEAGMGMGKCPHDYLLLNGVRLCGHHLNSNSFSHSPKVDAPITDNSSGPFIARFVSNEIINGRGFKLSFQQSPCGAVPHSGIATV